MARIVSASGSGTSQGGSWFTIGGSVDGHPPVALDGLA
jgi:hypothetical protein